MHSPQLKRILNVSFVAVFLSFIFSQIELYSFFPASICTHSPAQDVFFTRGNVALQRPPKSPATHHMSQHDWLTPSASHPFPASYTSQIMADPLSLRSHLYHFSNAQLTQSTTRQRGTPERGAALLRYRTPAVFKRAREAAPQMLLSRPIKSSVHLVCGVAVELSSRVAQHFKCDPLFKFSYFLQPPTCCVTENKKRTIQEFHLPFF